jgi:NAD(P)H-dependent flavin oxidoreductase YrpB (nitropropane dioxygenase family)
MPMIGVSDIRLAKATAAAGVLPSLNALNYEYNNLEDGLSKDLKEFDNGGNIMLNFLANMLYFKFKELTTILVKHKIRYVLIQYGDSTIEKDDLFKLISIFQKLNIKVFVGEHYHINNKFPGIFDLSDGVFVKGPGVAGICRDYDSSLVEAVVNFRNKHTKVPIIAVGGIGNKSDVDIVIDSGAMAVGIGTLFAVSKESSISHETKLKMVSSSTDDLVYLPIKKPEDPNYDGKQKALFFSDYENKTNDIRNRNGLMLGIKNQGGHVYAGNGINKINEILSVQEIVSRLI